MSGKMTVQVLFSYSSDSGGDSNTRSLVLADIDNDGDLEALITDFGEESDDVGSVSMFMSMLFSLVLFGMRRLTIVKSS